MSSNPTPLYQNDHSYQSNVTDRDETQVTGSSKSLVDPELLLFDLETACTKQAVYGSPAKSDRLISIPKIHQSKDKKNSPFETAGQDDGNWNASGEVKESEAAPVKSRSASPDLGSPSLEDLEVLEQSYPDDVKNASVNTLPIPDLPTHFHSFRSAVDSSFILPSPKATQNFGFDQGFHNWGIEYNAATNELFAPTPRYPPGLGWESGLGLGLNVANGFIMETNFNNEEAIDGTNMQEIEDGLLGAAVRTNSLEEGEIYEPGYDAIQREDFVDVNLEEDREDYVEIELDGKAQICRTVYHETAGEWSLRYDPKLKKYRAKNPTPLRISVSESNYSCMGAVPDEWFLPLV
jgi:hypothetical protein